VLLEIKQKTIFRYIVTHDVFQPDSIHVQYIVQYKGALNDRFIVYVIVYHACFKILH